MKNKKLLLVTAISLSLLTTACKSTSNLTNLQDVTTNTTDKSAYFPNEAIASVDNGYYMWDEFNNYLMFFDKEQEQQILLCNKPECEHSLDSNNTVSASDKCNAYYSSSYNKDNVWTYGDSILLLQAVDQKGLYLTQISADGSERKELVCLSENKYSEVNLIVHNGYAYYSLGTSDAIDGKVSFYKIKLKENEQPVLIDEVEGSVPLITHIKGYGDDIYYVKFFCENYDATNLLGSDMHYELKKYNVTTELTSTVVEDNIDDYVLDEENNTLYYHVCNGDVYKMNLTDNKSECIYTDTELPLCVMGFDGKYLYIDNSQDYLLQVAKERKIYALDTNGNIVKEIASVNGYNMCLIEYGDDTYMFGADANSLYIIDKEDMFSSSDIKYDKWKKVNIAID